MSANDGTFDRGSLVGNATVPRLTLAQIRGTVRRSDPDGTHNQPFWTGLSGKTILLNVGTQQAGVVTSLTITFTSDNYADAITEINSISPTDIRWSEAGGFACIQSIHAGDKNWLQVTGGTALSVLGMVADPAPGGFSQAGDLAPASPTKQQANPPTTELLAFDENLTSSTVNRAIIGAMAGLDRMSGDLNREVAVWRLVAMKFSSSSLILNSFSDANIRISSAALKQALADGFAYEDVVQLLNSSRKAYYKATSPVTRLKATGVSYGAGTSTSAITWGTPGGNLLTTTAAIQSLKQAAVNITSIQGATIEADSATFVTNRVQPGDIISIKSASNTVPFNHDGEFVITTVIDETHITVRPMGPNETLVDATEDRPLALNLTTSAGENYGTVQVYIGYSVPLGGKAATTGDCLVIDTNVSESDGTQVWARLPIAMTLRDAIVNGFLGDVAFDLDPQIAYLNVANEFALLNTFDAGISIPTLADLGGGLRNARVQLPITVSESTPLDPVAEQTGVNFGVNSFSTRVYFQTSTGGLTITTNAKYFPGSGNWQKDTTTADSTRVDILPSGITYSTQLAADPSIWADNAWKQIPFKMNIDDLTVDANALVARFQVQAPGGISVNRTLLLETKGTFDEGGGTFIYTRMYVETLGGGYSITSNARWDGTDWNKDVSGFVASHFYMVAGQFHVETRKSTSNAAWDDSSWDGTPGRMTLDAINAILRLPGQAAFDNVPGETSGIGSVPILSFDGSANSPNLVRFLRAATSSLDHTNIYFTPTGEMYISFGCHWEQATTHWVSDITGSGGGGGQLIKFSENRIVVYGKSSGTSWADSDPPTAGGWETKALDVQDLISTVNGTMKLGTGLGVYSGGALPQEAEQPRLAADLPVSIAGDTTLKFTKIMEWGTSGSEKFRLYVGYGNKEQRLTYNAQWSGDSSGWGPDTGSPTSNPSFAIELGKQFRMMTKADTSGGTWAESAWDPIPFVTDIPTGQTTLQVPKVSLANPLLVMADGAGNIRHLYDHNGYPVGRRSEFREEWQTGGTTTVLTGGSPPYNVGAGHQGSPSLVSNAPTKFQINGTGGSGGWGIGADSKILSNAIGFGPGTGTADKLYLQSIMSLCVKQNFMDLVLEWEAYSPAGVGDSNVFMGLFQDYGTMSTSNNAVWFKRPTGVSVWHTQTIAGGTVTDNNTAFSPSTSDYQRFRIEVHGSASAIGAFHSGSDVVFFFINETLVATHTANVYANGQQVSIGFGIENTSSSTADLEIGPVYATWNRFPSLPAL
jgi:hypothetical protein